MLTQGTGRGTTYILSEVFGVKVDKSRYTLDKEELIRGITEYDLGNNESNLGNNESSRGLMEISKLAQEKRRLQPDVLRGLILSLCMDQFLTIAELSHYLDRDADGQFGGQTHWPCTHGNKIQLLKNRDIYLQK